MSSSTFPIQNRIESVDIPAESSVSDRRTAEAYQRHDDQVRSDQRLKVGEYAGSKRFCMKNPYWYCGLYILITKTST